MDFSKVLKDEGRKVIFIGDLNYFDLDNGYSFISSYTANSWLIEKTDKVKHIFELSQNACVLNYVDCQKLGLDLIDNLYSEGMVGINESEELFSDMFEFNISDEPRKNEKFSWFILHITNECNLKCKYCFADAEKISRKSKRLSLKDVERIIKIIKNTPRVLIDDSFAIEFNSGEILCNKKILLEGIRLIKSYFADDERYITIPIQTNGTIYSSSVSKILKKYHMGLSVSYDGPKNVHDRNRLFEAGLGSHDIVLKNMEKYSVDGIIVGALATATNPSDISSVYEDFLKISNIISGFKINPVYICGRQQNFQDRDIFYREIANEYIKCFDRFIHDDMNRYAFLDPFSDMSFYLKSILYYENSFMCRTFPCGAGKNQLTFAFDGNIYPCQEFIGNNDFVIDTIDNMDSLVEIPGKIAKMSLSQRKLPEECQKCAFLNFCGNACVAHCYNANKDINSKIPECEYIKVVFKYLIKLLSENDAALINFIKKYISRNKVSPSE